MKIKKSIGLLALAGVLSASIGLCLTKVEASAETIYTSSQKDYWQIVEGSGDYTVSLDTAARTSSSGYKGVETVVTPADGVTDIAIELKGMVNPMANMIIYHDNQVKGEADADAIVYTYTSLTDPDKQVSIIAVNRGNRSWYTLSLTDDLEIKDGYAYIAGTNQKTIGLMDGTTYNTTGFNNWGAGENNWGAIYCGDVQQKIDSTGKTYNASMTYGTISNETFLTLSKENLAGTEYEERYTSEYVAEVLTELAKGARFEMKWYGVKTDKVDFHIRGISGSWIGDNGGNGLEYNLGVKHSVILYKKTNTLYVGETYKLSDLVYGGGYTFRNAQNASASLALSGWFANKVDVEAGNNSNCTWRNVLTQLQSNEITLTETGTYNVMLEGSFLGYYPTSLSSGDFARYYAFDVVEKTPVNYNVAGQKAKEVSCERWENITLYTPTADDLGTIPAGYEFTGWNINGKTYEAGSVYTVKGDGAEVVCNAVFSDVQKPVISVEDYTQSYYDGDSIVVNNATVTDNSNENITASVSVTKDGNAVEVIDSSIAVTAGTYIFTYTAKDGAGNEADSVVKTVVVKGKTVVNYSDGTNTVYTNSYRPGEITLAQADLAQIPTGYEFVGWKLGENTYDAGATYTLGEETVTFVASVKPIEYTATLDYLEEGKANEEIVFTIENRAEKLDEIKAKLPDSNNGYGNCWQNLPQELPLENVTYIEVQGLITYTVTFANVEGVEAITFTVETKDSVEFPIVPEKTGYTGEWDKTVADLTLADMTVTAVYTAVTYTVTFANVEGVEAITFTVETKDSVEFPAVPEKAGYTAAWDKAVVDLTLADATVTAVYTAITYTVTFANVENVEAITFTVETKDTVVFPAVPEKAGYTAAWDKAVADLTSADATITAVYTAIEYSATIVVNGAESTVTYTIENRMEKLADIRDMKPVADSESYVYIWETELPDVLPLENGKVYKVVRQDVQTPDDNNSSSSVDDETSEDEGTSGEQGNSNTGAGCSGSIIGGTSISLLAIGAMLVVLKKRKEN